MPALKSSYLAAADFENGELTVRFQDGEVWIYSGVPSGLYQALLDSPKPGTFFRRQIRDSFPSRQGA